jgi:hypothetical protein
VQTKNLHGGNSLNTARRQEGAIPTYNATNATTKSRQQTNGAVVRAKDYLLVALKVKT